MKNSLLLSDESKISTDDFHERKMLLEKFMNLPNDFIMNIRHLQPQIGCMNTCKFCSKNASNIVEHWTEKRMRNVIAAIKYRAVSFVNDFPLIARERKTHRPGVVFPYLDNDIGSYFYLDTFIELLYKELGVQTRISTIGYSRHNERLNKMHSKISSSPIIDELGGVRLSFTPYGKGWEERENYSREEYIEDIANFLKIYKKYYEHVGSGDRKMCVEIRYSPLVITSKVWITEINDHMIIATNNYLFISQNTNVNIEIAEIADPDNHLIELTQDPCVFCEINTQTEIKSLSQLKKIAEEFIFDSLEQCNKCEIYLMRNREGIYYAVNPKITSNGNYGMNIYPCTKDRQVSGYIITERFLLNAMFNYKNKKGIGSFSKYENATWKDVHNVLKLCNKTSQNYREKNKCEKADYISNVLEPMINGYVEALQKSGYPAKNFFDPDFTIDTGTICNLGRALTEFKGITKKVDEPLTPSHERNYGSKNSLMSKEGTVWRLSCGYKNTIVIEKLDLAATSSLKGQVVYREIIQLQTDDEILDSSLLYAQYLIPGQRRQNGNIFL